MHWYSKTQGARLKRVLEVGCGSGFMGVGFGAIGISYVGIDVDAAAIEFAVENGIDAHAVSIEGLPQSELSDGTYDLVLSSNTLEHVGDPIASFKAMRSVCSGLTVVVVPNPEGFLPRVKASRFMLKLTNMFGERSRDIAYTIDGSWHAFAYSKRTLEMLCREAGFSIRSVRSIGIDHPVFGFVQPSGSWIYRGVSSIAGIVDMESQLLLVAE